ncbi:MAG: ribbon-helix-helix protein, CopG family [candidate division KSB1 bacterium]|nr:ribbon-helix-helix protein, CopG family [candidate division KSB1 bacterium]MDZ7300889.1 ribbon-helix-helix protein, CopG family [candidate division KSB1 bacterium]MDZ7309841.1 ribbon-helix-helix protein, CopG family [candidate division KSB1 bacterium]
MKRTSIYLEEDQLQLLKHISSADHRSLTELVRQALQEFLERYQQKVVLHSPAEEWNRRLEQLLARVHQRTSAFSSEEIEADITVASEEARYHKAHAASSR